MRRRSSTGDAVVGKSDRMTVNNEGADELKTDDDDDAFIIKVVIEQGRSRHARVECLAPATSCRVSEIGTRLRRRRLSD